MNPFRSYDGLRLNGRWIAREDLNRVKPESPSERDVFAFVNELFDDSESITFFTSGSTSAPKPIEFPKSALITSGLSTNAFFGLNRDSTALLGLPLNFVAGKMMVVRALVGKFELMVTKPAANPLAALNERISFVPLTPYQVRAILNQGGEDLKRADTVLIGGGPVDPGMRKELAGFSNAFYASFGMTETLTHFALSPVSSRSEGVFELLEGVKASTDDRGCLVVERNGITPGPVKTNDLVELTNRGFKWLGRIDNLINSGGIKIIPERLESALENHLSAPFFIAGIPDEMLGEKAVLFVEGKEMVNLESLRIENPYERPKAVVYLERFEYTESGKIKRRATAEKWLSGG
jgi:O-succinylbenzoic acid--CoA ligase